MYDIQVAHPLRQLLGGGRGEDIQLTCQLLTIQHLRDGTHLVDGQMGAAQDTEVRFSSAGRGSFKVRAKWRYLKADNIIEVYEIPYSTTVEAILDKVAELIKAGRFLGGALFRGGLSGVRLLRCGCPLGGLLLRCLLRRSGRLRALGAVRGLLPGIAPLLLRGASP